MKHESIVLTLPGKWTSFPALLAAIERCAPDFYYVHGMLFDRRTGASVSLSFKSAHDSEIVRKFRYGGAHWVNTEQMFAVVGHTAHVVLSDAGGCRERIAPVMAAATAVVKAGALGVDVSSAGIAHAPATWLRLANEGPEGMFRAFVVTVDGGEQGAYSCGMRNFGLKDVRVSSNVSMPTAIVGSLTRQLVVNHAEIRAGQTIKIGGLRSERFDVLESTRPTDLVDPTYHNHFGMLQLIPRA